MHNYKILGVINLTPNSFSDGGIHLEEQKLLSSLNKFLSIKNLIIDVGFESTAPMNQPITDEEERVRFSFFLEFLLKHKELDLKILSLDTYKIKNFRYFYHELKKIYPEIKLVMNDVSGVLDEELAELLLDLNDVYYIHTFTRIPDRTLVLDHMKFLEKSNANIIEESVSHFSHAYDWFAERKLLERLIFDPGFGFSKTYEENWSLLDGFKKVVQDLKTKKIFLPWVIGLSKKSFLRKKCADAIDPMKASEEIHQKLVAQFLKNIEADMLFRVHDPEIVLKAMAN